jgi:hypothetical protein
VTLTLSPLEFSSHCYFYKLSCSWFLGDAAAPAFSGQLVYLQFTWEVTLPLSPVKFSSHCHFYKLSFFKVAGRVLSLLLSPAGLRGISPPPPSALRAPCPLCYLSFLLLFIIQLGFFSFFPGWGLVCSGRYAYLAHGCLWEYHTLLSSPGDLLLSSIWQCESPPGFSF